MVLSFQGASAYSTQILQGNYLFLNYIIGIYKVETDENENYENTETLLLSTHFGI
jgi:hypothetical protein